MASSNASEQLHLIAQRLKVVGDGRTMKRQMAGGIRAAAEPVRAALRASARAKLPKSGGLNERVANSRITVSVATGARTAGVRVRDREHDAVTTNSGEVRHPVFGTKTWVLQQIPKATGWWDDAAKRTGPTVTPAVLAVMERVAHEVTDL